MTSMNRHSATANLWKAAMREAPVAVVKGLLRAGADVNFVKDGVSPLWIACWTGSVGVVRALLEKGADVNLGRAGDSSTPLWIASWKGHLAVVSDLLEAGADQTLTAEDQTTPLWVASANGHPKVVKALLRARGAEYVINARDKEGLTPLKVAKTERVRELLLEAGSESCVIS